MPFPTRLAATIKAHQGACHTLTYSTGGQYILTGGSDRAINLYNSTTHALVNTYSKGHGYEILTLHVSTNNNTFLSGGGDRAVLLWDVASGKYLRRWSDHGGRVNAVLFAGEGGSDSGSESLVVSASFDTKVRFFDLKANNTKPIQVLEEAKDSVGCLAIRGTEVYTGSVDGRMRCYDIRMGCVYTDVVGPPVTSLDLTTDGTGVLVGTLDSTLRLFDRGSGGLMQTFKGGHKNDEYRVESCLGVQDHYVVTGSEDGYLVAYDLLEGRVVERVKAYKDGTEEKRRVLACVKVHPRGKQAVTAGVDGNVNIFIEH